MSGFKLVRPCAKCPFRTDIPAYLTKARVRELQRALVQGEFFCHETTDPERFDDGTEGNGLYYNPGGREEHCAGALILLERIERPSQMMRISERLGLYDRRKLDMGASVFRSFAAMIRAQRR